MRNQADYNTIYKDLDASTGRNRGLSPSSSLSSLASVGSMLQPAPPSNSSQSEILATGSDYSTSTSPPNDSKVKLKLQQSRNEPILTQLDMGQAFNRPAQLVQQVDQVNPSPPPPNIFPMVVSSGFKLKRALAHRRKGSSSREGVSEAGHSPSTMSTVDALVPRSPKKPKQLKLGLASAIHAMAGRKPSVSSTADSIPPTPPPKPTNLRIPVSHIKSDIPPAHERASFLPSPGTSAAIAYLRADYANSAEETQSFSRRAAGTFVRSDKDEWGSSDTYRPGSQAPSSQGSRTPRPLSFAESLNSTHTVVPNGRTQRLSTMVTEPEFSTPEEETRPYDDADSTFEQNPPPVTPQRTASLNFGSFAKTKRSSSATSPCAILPDVVNPNHEVLLSKPQGLNLPANGPFRPPPASISDSPTLTKAAANGVIVPLADGPAARPVDTNIRSKLAAWTATTSSPIRPSPRSASSTPPIASAGPLQTSLALQSLHSPQPRSNPHSTAFPPVPTHPSPSPSLRQTAISMTSGLAPAAGLAVGFGRRAMERMGKAWGSGGSNSSHSAAHSASQSSSSIGSQAALEAQALGERNGGIPAQKTRHNFPDFANESLRPGTNTAGSWSSSSRGADSSASDTENTVNTLGLGICVREPIGQGGLVFGRALADCTRETAVGMGNSKTRRGTHKKNGSAGMDMEIVGSDKALDGRVLPALVVRCVQHLERWGTDEEGLFRISGRTSHMNRLRRNFDTGADYDLIQCGPDELDVHAVASIFKAYLRELPEPILTQALASSFDAAMADEGASPSNGKHSRPPGPENRALGLPSSVHDITNIPTLRKPPSLSTFALPSFSHLHPFSDKLLNNIAALLARLPVENRDLLRTVTEVIRATSRQSKKTKMPLSNLLLVFCPSLSMSPSLLRLLCEGDGLWTQPPAVEPDEEVLNIHAPANWSDGPSSDTEQPFSTQDGGRSQLVSEESQRKRDSIGSSDLHGGLRPRNGTTPAGSVPKLVRDHRSQASGTLGRPRSSTDSIMRASSSIQSDSASFVSARDTPDNTPPQSTRTVPIPCEASRDISAAPTALPTSRPLPRIPTLALNISDPTSYPGSGPPIPFPVTPTTPSTLRSRMSLSFSSPNLLRSSRSTRPSLHSVFRKLSVPTLVNTASANSTSSKMSDFVTPNVIPVLDLSIDDSAVFGDAWLTCAAPSGHATPSRSSSLSVHPADGDGDGVSPADVPRSQTPIADLFLSDLASSSRPTSPTQLAVVDLFRPLGLATPTYSVDEDWARSVLLAADAGLDDNVWGPKQLSESSAGHSS